MKTRSHYSAAGILLVFLPVAPLAALAQEPEPRPEQRRMSVDWDGVPIRDVLQAFALFSGKSIVASPGVQGSVTATINDQPWDVALQAILATRGYTAVEDEAGIISVYSMAELSAADERETLVTRAYRLSHATADEVGAVLTPLLTDRGSLAVDARTNTVVVTDVPRVHRAIAGVVR